MHSNKGNEDHPSILPTSDILVTEIILVLVLVLIIVFCLTYHMVINREHSLVLQCYCNAFSKILVSVQRLGTVTASDVILDKASASEWSSVHFLPCAHLKGLVHTILRAT